MKAMILAAGLATRLRPYTEYTPKALFPLAGRPLIDRLVDRLAEAGCEAVIVNTHHLAERLEAHLAAGRYPIPVRWQREKKILGTGGGIANAADFFDQGPFMVVNGDIDIGIDLAAVYRFHAGHEHRATLVLTDFPEINTVLASEDGRVAGFDPDPPQEAHRRHGPWIRRTFTGIQVLDPAITERLDPTRFSSIVDCYRQMIAEGETVAAYFTDGRWADLGTPERYLAAAARFTGAEAFGLKDGAALCFTPLAGDGSQRRWYRVRAEEKTLVMVSHGIRSSAGTREVDAFVDIGRHLAAKKVPVPAIRAFDRFSGLAFVDDLGDCHLEAAARDASPEQTILLYRRVIEEALHMGLSGAEGFAPNWTWQSPRYDRRLILEKECRYFCETFVAGRLGRPDPFAHLFDEFSLLAERIEAFSIPGFLHRDLQSRNVMVDAGKIHFIDFQGGRLGPVQYDLASLLIDPYVALPAETRGELVRYGIGRLSERSGAPCKRCLSGYRYCALSRNLQILGAFGFLTAQGKPWFEAAIPGALDSLKRVIAELPEEEFPKLGALARELAPG